MKPQPAFKYALLINAEAKREGFFILTQNAGGMQMEQEERVKLHERLTSLEGSMKTIYNRADTLEDRMDGIENKQDIMHEMNTNIKIIAINQENQNKEIVTIKCDVKELKEKPAKRWDALSTLVITLVVSGIAGFILGKVFGG